MPSELEEDIEISDVSLFTLLKTKQFITLYGMFFLSIFTGVFAVGSALSWGTQSISSVTTLNLVAELSGLWSAFRFIWSFGLDKYTFKQVYGTMLVL